MSKQLILGYCPQGNGHSIFPFDDIFDVGQDISKSIKGVDAVVFWGGTDIHSSFYNEPFHKMNQQQSPSPIARDVFEKRAMLYCIANHIPIIGVCRGAQLLCAVAGGSLVQHTGGHNSGNHDIVTSDGETFSSTSCHHQMMYPWDIEHELLAWTPKKLSSFYENGWNKPMKEMEHRVEPEIVYFPSVRGLAIQGHPEWASQSSKFVLYCNTQIIQKLLTNSPVAA
jgi:hypothetical protein